MQHNDNRNWRSEVTTDQCSPNSLTWATDQVSDAKDTAVTQKFGILAMSSDRF